VVAGRAARRVASARDIDESPRYAAGTLMTWNAPVRACIMTGLVGAERHGLGLGLVELLLAEAGA
jgi:hypothetical protein